MVTICLTSGHGTSLLLCVDACANSSANVWVFQDTAGNTILEAVSDVGIDVAMLARPRRSK